VEPADETVVEAIGLDHPNAASWQSNDAILCGFEVSQP
jgi:hypothetical protein